MIVKVSGVVTVYQSLWSFLAQFKWKPLAKNYLKLTFPHFTLPPHIFPWLHTAFKKHF